MFLGAKVEYILELCKIYIKSLAKFQFLTLIKCNLPALTLLHSLSALRLN